MLLKSLIKCPIKKFKRTIHNDNNIAKLRNAKFTNCNFNNLKFIDNPMPEMCKEEGYDYKVTYVPLPLDNSDSAQTTKPQMRMSKRLVYDRKLRDSYRIDVINKKYDTANVFGDSIRLVDFEHSTIESSNLNNIRFVATNFSKTTLSMLNLNEIRFLGTKFYNCAIEHSKFSNIKFVIEISSEFINIEFMNVIFNETSFENTLFHNCVFIGCNFEKVSFNTCFIGAKFINCNFKLLDIQNNENQDFSPSEFNINNFKTLCNNKCNFE